MWGLALRRTSRRSADDIRIRSSSRMESLVSVPIPLPPRPIRVSPPGIGARSQISLIAIGVLVFAGVLFFIIPPIRDLRTDWSIGNKAEPVPGGSLDGHCTTQIVLTRCDATLRAPNPQGGEYVRKVDYFFIDAHAGDYSVMVVADPARPELLSTDLALDKLDNRLFTQLALGPLFLGIGVLVLWGARRRVREQRARIRALDAQPLRAIALRVDDYALEGWTVSSLPPEPVVATTWHPPHDARPIVLEPHQRLILGVTSGDGSVAMPVDADLRWLELDDHERQTLRRFLPPNHAQYLPALDPPAQQAIRARLRRTGKRLLIAGAVAAGAAGVTAAMWIPHRATMAQRDLKIACIILCAGLAVALWFGSIVRAIKVRRREAILR